jgi:hypothetical protein
MIKINGIEIAMEGDFGTLIKEVARAAHAVARAASDKFERETDGEVDYDHVVEMILEELAHLKRFDKSGSGMEMPDELEEDFYANLQKERQELKDAPSFIDFDTERPDPNAGRNIIQSAIKDVFLDHRTDHLDEEDLKAIKKAKKKKKKK